MLKSPIFWTRVFQNALDMAIAVSRIELQTLTASNDGPLLVFFPGMDGTDLSLKNQLDNLKSVFNLRCLSVPPDDRTPWQGLVQDILALIAAEPKRPIYLCGESFGACLALQVAIQAPNRFDRLILINPASSFQRQLWSQWLPDLVRQVPVSAYHWATRGALPFLTALDRVSHSNRQALLNAMRSLTPESVAWRLASLKAFSLDPQSLQRLTLPVLLIAASADRLLPSVAEMERLRDLLPNAQGVLLPKSGHACLLEEGH
jgi:pimeloyl-ACP methyl ester carboxylesterase